MDKPEAAKLSVADYQFLWAKLVRELLHPTLQALADEYTADPQNPASVSKRPVETYVLEVPGKASLCVAPDPSAGLVRIYDSRGEGDSSGSQEYTLEEVTGPLLRDRAGQSFGAPQGREPGRP